MTSASGSSPPGFDLFVHAKDVHAMKEAVVMLQKNKALATVARDPAFTGRFPELRSIAIDGHTPTDLEALALLFRIGAVAKMLRPQIEAIASEVIASPKASPQTLSDSDDRRYLGDALKFSSGSWKRHYLSNATVEEVSGEEARVAFVAALVADTTNIADAVRALASALESWSVETQDVGASRVRRLVRITNALRSAIVASDPDTGENLGSALLNFARSALGGEDIVDRDLQTQTAKALFELLGTIVRFHFSLASDVETFAVVMLLRRWFHARGWPPKLDEEREVLSRQVTEALVLLAKQGIGDDGLRKTLLTLLDSGESTAQLSRIANEVSGIPSDLRSWLITGQRSPVLLSTNDAIDETILRSIDRDIATLFKDSDDLQSTLDRLEDDILAALGAYEPKLTPTANRLTSTARRIVARVNSLAKRRSMKFKGRTGDTVEYNPVDHEPPLGGKISRIVRIRRPSVERTIEGMPPSIILKADIEDLE